MEPIKPFRFIVVICLLLLTAAGIAAKDDSVAQPRDISLAEAVIPAINSWTGSGSSALSSTVVDALELDDYVNQNFVKRDDTVSLYVGYYLNQVKVGAAHSPLVCFPGQGWMLSDRENKLFRVGDDQLHLAQMVINKGEEKQLVLYWFQAYDQTSPETFRQKLILLRAKLLFSREDNAFVRVMVPFGGERSMQQAQTIGEDFIQSFYPAFKKYLTDGPR